MLRRLLGPITLISLFGCTPAQPADAPGPSTTSSASSVPTEPDEIAVAAEGDPDLERALREARSHEKKRISAERKVAAWQAVVDLAGEKKIGELAAERLREWGMVLEAEKRRPEALQHLREAYEESLHRLQSLTLSLTEFCVGFRPHAQDLEELKVNPPLSSVCGAD